MTTTHHEELAKQTVDAINEYWQARYSRYSRYSGCKLDSAVHFMLGSSECYSDNILSYEDNIHALFEALSKPEVSTVLEKHLGSRGYEETVDMFASMMHFFRSLDGDDLRLQLDAYDIEHYYNGYSEDNLLRIQIEYKTKLAGIKAQAKEEERLKKEAKLKAA